jgi:hypothetical protein
VMRLPARMRTWGKRGYGLLEDWVVVLGSLRAAERSGARCPPVYGGFVVI